jgi:hypothetical protein
MFKYLTKLSLVLLWVVCLISCSSANNKPILIRFSPDSTAIVFSGIDPAGLLQVRNTPNIDTAYSGIISIIKMEDDGDAVGIEKQVRGKIHVNDSTIVFSPLGSFVPGKNYLITSYLNAKFGDVSMMLTGKLNNKVKPEQVILKR